jgi:hypothetical protein
LTDFLREENGDNMQSLADDHIHKWGNLRCPGARVVPTRSAFKQSNCCGLRTIRAPSLCNLVGNISNRDHLQFDPQISVDKPFLGK